MILAFRVEESSKPFDSESLGFLETTCIPHSERKNSNNNNFLEKLQTPKSLLVVLCSLKIFHLNNLL